MKTIFFQFSLLFLTCMLFSCEVKQQPIAYGQANCAHCQMTVSDKRFGSEIVSKTGKAFFFDAPECMIKYLQENKEIQEKAELTLVSDFTNPGNLVFADKATFLQSKNLPSPMGMFLTAYENEAAASEMQEQKTGKVMNWEEVRNAVRNNHRPE